MRKSGVVSGLGAGKNLSIGGQSWGLRCDLGCRIADLDRGLLLHDWIRPGSFRRLLLKPGTWHALPLRGDIDSSKNRLMLRQASFLVSIRCSGGKLRTAARRNRIGSQVISFDATNWFGVGLYG